MADALAIESRTAEPPAEAEPSPRARLIAAATNLFCRHGINATGVDAVIAEAGTAKTTLYKIFGSKDALVEAVLEVEGQRWRDWFLTAIDNGGSTPRAKLAAMFPALKSWFAEERFYGCPFINAVGEHDKSDDRLRAITLRHKSVVLGRIEDLSAQAGAAEPALLAHQLGLLIDGAIVAAMVTRRPDVADAAGAAAQALLERIAPTSQKKRRAR